MRHRAVASFSALLAVIAVVGLATHGVAGQTPATSKPAPRSSGSPGSKEVDGSAHP